MSTTAPPSYTWFLRKTPIFREQSETLYASAEGRATTVKFERGDTFDCAEGDRLFVFLIVQGEAKSCTTNEAGKELIIDVLGEGDLFGPLESVVRPDSAPIGALGTQIVALSEGLALRYDLAWFQEAIQKRPTLGINISRVFGLRRQRLEIRLKHILYRSTLGKVAGLLGELAEGHGKPVDGGTQIGVRLRHHEMASIIGSRRASVSEALAELEYRGLIHARQNRLVILKPEELEAIP